MTGSRHEPVSAEIGCHAVPDDAVLCTDGSALLASAALALDIEHQPVNLQRSERINGQRE